MKLIVNTKTEKYPIIIGSNLISNLSNLIKKNSILFQKCLLVVDQRIPKQMVAQIKKSLKNKKLFVHFFNANEKNKNQINVNAIVEILLSKNFSRQDCLMSIGGGITGDLGGFAASIFKRGIQFINMPTTLLSQVDSSVGGKTGINSVYGKNLIGSFYQPKLVISDTRFLKSLPQREIICGYGEILKHSLISNKNFYKFLKKNVFKILSLKSPFLEKAIYESCKIKKIIVENDEKEKNFRKVLNFGHTFAHAYEAASGYSKKLNHGEAVILGMMTALRFSLKYKYLDQKNIESISNHIQSSNLPLKLNKFFSKKDINKILFFMGKDKKNNSKKINLILLKKIGLPLINMTFDAKKLKFFLNNELS